MAEAFTGIETDLTLLEWSDLESSADAAAEPRGAGHVRPHDRDRQSRRSGLSRDRRQCRSARASAPTTTTSARSRDRSTSSRISRRAATLTTSSARARARRSFATTCAKGSSSPTQYKLPRALRAFITEHHGTGTISYFLDKARQREADARSPREYVYPGPLPQTAETAVVMLADGVEAAARVLHEPTPQKIRDVVEHIVRQRMEQGQLDRRAAHAAPDRDRSRRSSRACSSGMYHNRIDYPAASGGITSEFASA